MCILCEIGFNLKLIFADLGEWQMKPAYERENLTITEFDTEDVIATSGQIEPTDPVQRLYERENAYRSFGSFDKKTPGQWF